MAVNEPNGREPEPPNSWQRLKDLVADALELPPEQRDAFVRGAPDADEETRKKALSIIQSDTHDGFIHPRVDAFVGLSGPNPSELSGKRIGRYTLDRLIGEGAMSAVYLARQDGVERPVALKVLRRAALSYDAQRRFAREVAAHGRIVHPGVATLIDAGVAREPGSPGDGAGIGYIAMEWVDGLPLTTWARVRKLGLLDRLRLMADIADAVHAAHQRAILHRDLKPANVLVVDNGGYGQPKVLDFSIAAILDPGTTESVLPDRTTASVLTGTLGYMSPEQARGNPHTDVRSDVYALGILLHELLVGRLPVEVTSLPVAHALARLADPQVSRERIGNIAGDTTGGDLHAALLTALSPEPERRYASAQALADDLRRIVDNQPVSARLPTRIYLLRKFAKRNRATIFAASAVLLSLVAGLGVAVAALYRESAAREHAEISERRALASLERATLQTRRARSARGFVSAMLESADLTAPGGSATVTLLDAIRGAEAELPRHVAGDPVVEADVRGTLARALRGLGDVDAADAQFALAMEAAKRATSEPEDYSLVTMIGLGIDRLVMLANDGRAEPARKLLAEIRQMIEKVDTNDAYRAAWRVGADMGEAAIVQSEGDGARSGELYADLLARAETLFAREGPSGPISAEELSTIQNNAATAFIDAGDSERAAEVLGRVVAYRVGRYGPTHPTTLAAMRNRAASLDRQGHLDEAAKIAEDVLTKSLETLGPDHLLTMSARDTLMSVAAQRQATPELERALALADANVAALEHTDQQSTPEMVLQVANRANLLSHLKRYAESAQGYARALEIGSAVLGAEHPYVLSSQSNLGSALASLGKIDEGKAHMRAVLEIRRRTLGDEHRSTLSTRNSLAMVAVEARDTKGCAESVEELAACVAIAERKEYVTLLPTLRRNLGRALMLVGELDRAEPVLRLAYEGGSSLSATHQQRTAAILADLARERNDPAEAARWQALAESTPGSFSTTMPSP